MTQKEIVLERKQVISIVVPNGGKHATMLRTYDFYNTKMNRIKDKTKEGPLCR